MYYKIILVIALLSLPLNACASNSPTAVQSNPAVSETDPANSATHPPASETTAPDREAVLSEIEKTVSAKVGPNDEFISAQQGMVIYLGGVVETGVDGKARLDLLPDGTIVRVGPNSSFALPELTLDENGEPKTTIELLFGKIFVLLNGGSLSVSTPSGVATVRGSLISVGFDPETGTLTAGCLEGHCTIEGEDGEEIDIPEGEESFVEEGEIPSEPDPLDQEDIEEWLEEVSESELEEFLDELPEPENYPEDEASPEATEAPIATDDASATEEPDSIEEPTDDSGGDSGG